MASAPVTPVADVRSSAPAATSPQPPPRGAKLIAITIDDGPALTYVLKAMDEAEKVGGHLTFFVTGRHLSQDPQIARIITKRGHQIGNHTWDHVALAKLPEAKIRQELGSVNDLIVKSGGARPTFYRPPYGSHNAFVDKIAASMGLKCAMWDVDPQDWNGKPGAQTTSIILSQARPNAIILMHEVHNTYLSLGTIFGGLTKRGFTLVRLDQLPPKQPRPTKKPTAKKPKTH